ncbi:MAG: aminotransferase class III-fold pyridoxal phosphate-dependent enzyme [Acidobacteriota bacterium]|nr:aminotransferase class III-fold pyridoxal phosphate-dependent enzyme [Acidobacteriota bacterium]
MVYFSNTYHGVALGALAVTGNPAKRRASGVPLAHTTPVPFEGYFGGQVNSRRYLEALLEDPASGLDLPAAIILETVQAEGGVNVASSEWLKRLAGLARRYGVLLTVDDIQIGCGRTGTFFSFEPAGIKPDIVCLSKSIRPPHGPGAPQAGARRLSSWRAQRHLPGQQSRLRHRGRGPLLLGRRRARPRGPA